MVFVYAIDFYLATASGFGRTSNTGGTAQSLMWTNLRIISNEQCAKIYGTSIIVSSTLCALGYDSDNQSTCNGDSGGPLITEVDGEKMQIGVVSFVSSAGCSSGNPSGYARTTHFRNWINQKTGV